MNSGHSSVTNVTLAIYPVHLGNFHTRLMHSITSVIWKMYLSHTLNKITFRQNYFWSPYTSLLRSFIYLSPMCVHCPIHFYEDGNFLRQRSKTLQLQLSVTGLHFRTWRHPVFVTSSYSRFKVQYIGQLTIQIRLSSYPRFDIVQLYRYDYLVTLGLRCNTLDNYMYT